MAGQPRAFALLLGMGLRSFSMSPAFIPYIKEFARVLSTRVAEEILEHALRFHTTARVANYLTSRLTEVFPEFDQFDVKQAATGLAAVRPRKSGRGPLRRAGVLPLGTESPSYGVPSYGVPSYGVKLRNAEERAGAAGGRPTRRGRAPGSVT